MIPSELFPNRLTVSEEGFLKLSNYNIIELVEKFSTPLYIYDAETIHENIQHLKDLLSKHYPGKSTITYAAKAYFSYKFARFLAKFDIGIDAVSENELLFALNAGVSPDKIHFHGNNKSEVELFQALQSNIHAIVVDNFQDIQILEKLHDNGVTIPVWIRINPEIDVNTHPYRNTGHSFSKFGFTMSDGQAEKAIKHSLSNPKIHLKGIHFHIGSQIFETIPYKLAIKKVLKLAWKCKWLPDEICPGGGWGVPYTREEISRISIENWVKDVSLSILEEYQNTSFIPHLILEPGRWIVARAGIAIYQIGRVKILPSGDKLIAIDGGIGDNIRPALYQSKYEALVAEKPLEPSITSYQVVGRYCESGDELIHRVDLPEVQPGNHLVVPVSGAYHLSMASNYNLVSRPAVLMVDDHKIIVLQKRENLWSSWWH